MTRGYGQAGQDVFSLPLVDIEFKTLSLWEYLAVYLLVSHRIASSTWKRQSSLNLSVCNTVLDHL